MNKKLIMLLIVVFSVLFALYGCSKDVVNKEVNTVNTKTVIEEKTEDAVEEKTEGGVEEKTEGGVEEKTEVTVEEKTEGDIEENVEVTVEEKTEATVEDTVEEIDPTVNIKRPYDDVDYSPQDKVNKFKNNPPIEVKGIYITAYTAGGKNVDKYIDLINNTELNAIVIDVKDDDGNMLFYSEAAEKYVPIANTKIQTSNINALMKKFKDNNIYTIARIVTFKSPKYAVKYPERAITYKNSGKLYYADGAYWASPFDKELWAYNTAVAKEALEVGFNEIQFDYVRFPATGSKLDKKLDFKNPNDNSKTFAVQEFVKYARSVLNPLEGYISLDVFGWTATTTNDSGIGQHWEGMSNVADYMSPMVYPSHYGKNNFGLAVPDANPYKTVYASMSDAIERNENIKTPAKLRPWLQGFTAKWVRGYIPYRTVQIRAQIQACIDLGIDDYIFWNASNNYPEAWFKVEE